MLRYVLAAILWDPSRPLLTPPFQHHYYPPLKPPQTLSSCFDLTSHLMSRVKDLFTHKCGGRTPYAVPLLRSGSVFCSARRGTTVKRENTVAHREIYIQAIAGLLVTIIPTSKFSLSIPPLM
jgi:hypothetical protein